DAMSLRRLPFVLAAALLFLGYAAIAAPGDLKSGPQAGDNLPASVNSIVVYSLDSSYVGKSMDFTERYGQDPVILVFAREMNKPVAGLVKKLDAELAKRKAAKLRAIVIILREDDAAETSIKDLVKEGVRNVDLAIMKPAGPMEYKLSKDAAVTVLLYKRMKVSANHAFAQSTFNEKGVERILADIPKIVAAR